MSPITTLPCRMESRGTALQQEQNPVREHGVLPREGFITGAIKHTMFALKSPNCLCVCGSLSHHSLSQRRHRGRAEVQNTLGLPQTLLKHRLELHLSATTPGSCTSSHCNTHFTQTPTAHPPTGAAPRLLHRPLHPLITVTTAACPTARHLSTPAAAYCGKNRRV